MSEHWRFCFRASCALKTLPEIEQGMLKVRKNEIRVVVTIAKGANGGWTASKVTPDDGSNPVLASSVTFDGSTLKIAFDAIRATYEGALSESKNSSKGTLTQGSPVPLDLDRATDESSWRRDRTPHKIHFIEVDDCSDRTAVMPQGNQTASPAVVGPRILPVTRARVSDVVF